MKFNQKKNAYPYITIFKKEPFKSFVQLGKQEIGSFYFGQYDKITEFLNFYKSNIFDFKNLSLKNLYWFLLLIKFLREDITEELKGRIIDFISGCEIEKNGMLGFISSPYSQQMKPDLWSTYYALSSLRIINYLKLYLKSKGETIVLTEIKEFINVHDKKEKFIHCLEKDCEICKKSPNSRTLYYVLELLILLGFDIRNQKSKYSSYVGVLKEDPDIVFKTLCLKFLDLELQVTENQIQYLYEFQLEDGGFSFKDNSSNINTTFWISYTFENYSWILDYNPSGIYSFVNLNLNKILENQSSWDLGCLNDISKLIIILSIIWNKFIEEIERTLFKEIENKDYIELKQLKNLFGLSNVVEEIISYLNLNYTFNLKILNNNIEFKNFLRNLTPSEKILASEFYEQISNKSVVSLTEIIKKFNSKYQDQQIKVNDLSNLIQKMIDLHFFEGEIKTKKKFLIRTKYYFYLNFILEKIIVSDTKINTDRLFEEKKILKDIKNDIYNMTLKLQNIIPQIKEEIESYLYINEIEIARQRLRFIVRDALMEADFLNENIENSFNEDLYYINLRATLGAEINRWNQLYSILSSNLKEVNSQLQEKITEKEEIKKYNNLLNELDNRLKNLDNYFNKKINGFRKFLSESLQGGYSDKKFGLILEEFNSIISKLDKFDEAIYNISQKITLKEDKLIEKHKKLISYWISIKNDLKKVITYYSDGLDYFQNTNERIEELHNNLNKQISIIDNRAKQKVDEDDFQAAFELIKKELDIILEEKLGEIKEIQKRIKKQIKKTQKLFVLFQYLQEKLELMEEKIIEIVSEKNQVLKEKVIKERNRAKIEKFDNFVSENIQECRKKLISRKKKLDEKHYIRSISIHDLHKELNNLLEDFEEINDKYEDFLEENKKIIDNFEEKSNLTIMQWQKFKEYFMNEIENSKNEYTNRIIIEYIYNASEKSGTNYVDLKSLSKKLNLKCKDTNSRIKEMIEFSKFNGELHEDNKEVLVYTDSYYKNKELRDFINDKIIRYNNETISKTLSLYDSCIRNRTLNINILELSNRINDLNDFDTFLNERFSQKVKELDIDLENRKEYKETYEYFDSIIQDSKMAIKKIKKNLDLFKNLQNSIEEKYNSLLIGIDQEIKSINAIIEESKLYEKIKDYFNEKKENFEEKIREVQNNIEEELKEELERNSKSKKLIPELRENFVKKKNLFLENYNQKIKNVNQKIIIRRNELFQGELLKYINNSKIKLSQFLGMLQTRVEDNIEIKEYKYAYSKIEKRVEKIEETIQEINSEIQKMVNEFSKKANDFENKNKYIIDNFKQYLNEYDSILVEKVKTLERLILKSFIEMAIKAVSNEFLTVSFLHKELNIKKQNLQDLILTLISSGELSGKYDPRVCVYYEDPKVLENMDEKELQVIKSMNYKLYRFLNRLKNFTTHYSSIIAFFVSIVTLSYYLLLLSGFNPFVLIIPAIIIIGLIYYLLKKRQEEEDIEI